MQRKQSSFCQQANRHQRGSDDSRRHWLNALGEQGDVEGAVGAVQQYRAQHVEHRAEQREEQVAERRLQGLRAPIEAHQRHAGEGQKFERNVQCEPQKFERNVQCEQVAGKKHGVECPPDRQQQCPEHERGTRLGDAGRRLEIGTGEECDRQKNDRRRQQHDRRQAIGAQRDAQRRRPATQQIDLRLPGVHQLDDNRHGEYQPERNRQKRYAPGIAPTKDQRSENTKQRHDERQDEQETARRRRFRKGDRQAGGSLGSGAASVAAPVASCRRWTRATASAVAEKATTIPVMTSACGTGSPPMPSAAPRRATTPKSRKTPLPIRLNARILRSGCGLTIRP